MSNIVAVVLQQNTYSFAACGGKSKNIPCGDNQQLLGEHWAVPVKDGGIFRGYTYEAKTATAPTYDSIAITIIQDKLTGEIYHILGTAAQLDTACGGGAALPLASTIPVVVPEFSVCADTTGAFIWVFTPPAKTSGVYKPYVGLNNTQPVPPPVGGLADVAAVVAWLNTNYSAAGTWSAVGNTVKLVGTSATETVGIAFIVA